MQFTRHAKNKLREEKLSRAEVEFVLRNPVHVERETRGNWRYVGQVEGQWIRVVLAGDDPDVVITSSEEASMKADFDSEANALMITMFEADAAPDDFVSVDEYEYCNLSLLKGQVMSLELLFPADNLKLLPSAAARCDLDGQALEAAAKAALAAPDREVTIGIGGRLAGSR